MADGRKHSDTEEMAKTRRHIGMRMHVLARFMRKTFDRNLTSRGITRSRWSMIAVAALRPGCTQRMLAEALEMSEASAGRLVDRLCTDGLLRREERDDDRRARAIYVTEQAKPLLDEFGELARANEQSVFRGFDGRELAQFQEYLDRVYHNVTHPRD